MHNLIAATGFLLLIPPSLLAQNNNQPARHLAYVFEGFGSRGMGFYTGFGGEGYLRNEIGLGADVGVVGLGTFAHGNPNKIGVGSADMSYRLFSNRAIAILGPFVSGGYTMFFGQDTGTPEGGNLTHGFNIGGGSSIWETKHYGGRFEIRYYGHGGRILWASYPTVAQFNFIAFRFAMTFR
jgi:hypothetical protein